MHPEIARDLMAQRQAELLRRADMARMRHACRRPRPVRQVRGISPSLRPRWRLARRLRGRLPWGQPRASCGAAGVLEQITLPGVFLDGPEAFGLRTYLTAAEARQLTREWSQVLAGFADRVDDPARRPADAVLFEVVVLGRPAPDLAGTARGLAGPGRAH
jgi:hypothetical protein